MRTFKPKSSDYHPGGGGGGPGMKHSKSHHGGGKWRQHGAAGDDDVDGRDKSHYASSPHLFVFQAPHEEDGVGAGGAGGQQPSADAALAGRLNAVSLAEAQQLQLTPGGGVGGGGGFDEQYQRQTLRKHEIYGNSANNRTAGGVPNSYTDYHIYSSTNNVSHQQANGAEQQNRRSAAGVRRITEKYDSLKRLNERAASLDLCEIGVVGGQPQQQQQQQAQQQEAEEDSEEDFLTLSDRDVHRIESFFRGLKTSVYVCRSLANLYVGGIDSRHSNRGWGERKFTGVPLLLLDCGQTRSRDKRQLQIVLAERESGFTLWREIIDNLTDYRASTDTFHTMYASKNHRVMFGLSFDSSEAAREFLSRIETLTSNPANISLSGPGMKKSKSYSSGGFGFGGGGGGGSLGGGSSSGSARTSPAHRSKSSSKRGDGKYKPPKKCDISTPCFFQHITKLGSNDHAQLYSLRAYVSSGSSNSSTAGGSDV